MGRCRLCVRQTPTGLRYSNDFQRVLTERGANLSFDDWISALGTMQWWHTSENDHFKIATMANDASTLLGASLFYQCWWQNRRRLRPHTALLSKPFEKGRIAFERTRTSTHGKKSALARLSIESLCEATKLIPNLGGRQILHFISSTVRAIFGCNRYVAAITFCYSFCVLSPAPSRGWILNADPPNPSARG